MDRGGTIRAGLGPDQSRGIVSMYDWRSASLAAHKIRAAVAPAESRETEIQAAEAYAHRDVRERAGVARAQGLVAMAQVSRVLE
jgi:hypothetical protein